MIDFGEIAARRKRPAQRPLPDAPFDSDLALFSTTVALALMFDLVDAQAAAACGLDTEWRNSVIESACEAGKALLVNHPPYQEALANAAG